MRTLLLLACAFSALSTFSQKDPMAKREAKVRRLLAREKPYKAISLCNGALGIEDRPIFHVLRADARNRIGDHFQAMNDARTGVAGLPKDPEAILQLAIAQQGVGNTDSAVILYRGLLALKDEPNTRYRLATTLQFAEDYPAALAELSGAMASVPEGDPSIPKFLRSRGECMALARDTAGARTTFQQALALVPDDPVILNSRAWFLYAAWGDHARAITDYNRAIKQNPNYSYAFNNRGWSKFKLGDTAGALKDINLARKKKPLNPYPYRNIGLIALHNGDSEEACDSFRRALELNYTALHGDDVERLFQEHCAKGKPVPTPAPVNTPDGRKPPPPPARTNAPE